MLRPKGSNKNEWYHVPVILAVSMGLIGVCGLAALVVHRVQTQHKHEAQLFIDETNVERSMWAELMDLKPITQTRPVDLFAQDFKDEMTKLRNQTYDPLHSEIPQELTSINIASSKYQGLSNSIGWCFFSDTDSQGICNDQGQLSKRALQDFKDILIARNVATYTQAYGPNNYKMHNINWQILLGLFLLINTIGGFLAIEDMKGLNYIEKLDDNKDKLARALGAWTIPPFMVIALGQHSYYWLGRIKTDKMLSKAMFAQELEQARSMRKKLSSFELSPEVDQARRYLDATIKTLQQVPKEIKRDEDRIKAVNMIKEANGLLLPAQMVLQGHKELMQEYHDQDMKQSLKELVPKDIAGNLAGNPDDPIGDLKTPRPQSYHTKNCSCKLCYKYNVLR